jgi:hypothetical protein
VSAAGLDARRPLFLRSLISVQGGGFLHPIIALIRTIGAHGSFRFSSVKYVQLVIQWCLKLFTLRVLCDDLIRRCTHNDNNVVQINQPPDEPTQSSRSRPRSLLGAAPPRLQPVSAPELIMKRALLFGGER